MTASVETGICRTTWSLVTPQVASEWLTNNFYEEAQRDIREYHYARLGKLHQKGELDGRAINIVFGELPRRHRGEDPIRKILNGYHCTKAVQTTQKPLWCNVTFAKCKDAADMTKLYSVYDTQMRRTLADALKAQGIVVRGRGSYLQGFANAARIITANFVGASLKGTQENVPGVNETADVSKEWIQEMHMYAEIADAAEIPRMKFFMRNGICLALGLITFRHQTKMAKQFWKAVVSGDAGGKHDPRRRLYEFILSREDRRVVSPLARFRLLMTVWNKYINHDEIQSPLRYDKAHSTLSIAGTPYPRKVEKPEGKDEVK